ncbi:MAG: thioredoxin-dependent thiol peroxidase [Candidatus Aenigmarchaeota archaeon]|nr:thioredoxin-dependent thiol peroxidase [Candidatus Aenigmarchaeota archaeon]
MKLKIGDKAPDFSLPDSDGNLIRLSDFLGQYVVLYVVLYFYPKDDTPGCTTEACEFNRDEKKFHLKSIKIIGISADSPKIHKKFAEKYKLHFTLLSDIDHKVCEKYGVWIEKNMYGKKYMGIARTTFIIDRKGVIKNIYEKVKPEDHSKEVLKEI